MTDVIGRAILENVIDSTGAKVGAAEGISAAQRLEKASVDAARKIGDANEKAGKQSEESSTAMSRASQRLLAQIERESQQAGRSRADYLALRAAQSGITDQAAPLIARLKEQEEAARKAGIQFNQYGLSAKQTAAALRQVPAQLTDIVVSLQGGQAPLTVLLQQGGQLKDVFGGVVPAAKALGGALLGLINPYSLAAAAAAAVGFAYFKASEQADAFSTAAISSGNLAGTSAAGLQQAANAVGDITGRYGAARDAAEALAKTGAITGNQLRIALQGVVSGAVVTGKSVQDLTKDFADLAKDPVDGILKLNNQYNFLTVATLEQIRVLKEQGREQDATTLAFNTFADALNTRRAQVEANYGFFQRLARGVAKEFSSLGNSILNIGAPPNLTNQIAVAQNQLRSMLQTAGPSGPAAGTGIEAAIKKQVEYVASLQRQAAAEATVAEQEGARAKAQRDGVVALEKAVTLTEQYAPKQQKLNKELNDYRLTLDKIRAGLAPGQALPQALDPAVIARTEAGIRDKFKDKATRPRVFRDDEATKLLIKLKETEASLQAQLLTDEKLGMAAQARVKFEAEIAELKEKKVLTADQKSLLANEDALLTQLRKNEAIEKEVQARTAATKEAERLGRLEAAQLQRSETLRQSLADRAVERSAASGRILGAFGRGDVANQRVDAENDIRRRSLGEEQSLNRSTPLELRDSARYLEDLALIRQARDKELQDLGDFYAEYDRKQGDFVNGATRALENYYTSVQDIAGQTDRLFASAFQQAEDALVEFTMTGKLSFSRLADSIVADINRMIIKQQILGPLAKALGLGIPQGASGGGGGGFDLGGLIGSGLNALFGRASGGPVEAGSMYRVNENAPELLNVQGKQYLMMGNNSGTVTPTGGQQAVVNNSINVNITATPGMSRDTALQQGLAYGRGISQALDRNGR